MFKVMFTAARMTEESTAEGIPAEMGWIVPEQSMTNIIPFMEHESITPESFETEEEAVAYIEKTIGSFTRHRDNFYSEDTVTDYVTGDQYSYTANITQD